MKNKTPNTPRAPKRSATRPDRYTSRPERSGARPAARPAPRSAERTAERTAERPVEKPAEEELTTFAQRPNGERLQKVLARGGLASRRHAESLITGGRVRVNGHIVTELGTRVDPRRDRVEVDGTRVVAEKNVYLVMHKPRGVVSTLSDPEGRPTVKELLGHVDARVYPVGRLDFATSGVLLATNDGAFADGLLHPKKAVPKTYVVKVAGTMQDTDLDRWREGVELEDGKTLPAEVSLIRYESGEGPTRSSEQPRDGRVRGKTWFDVTIREGRNQQIRRMGVATGFEVMRLSRTAFAGVTSEGMRPGAVRSLTYQELSELKKTYGVPRSIPGEIEPNLSTTPLRAPWRAKRGEHDASAPKPEPRGDRRSASPTPRDRGWSDEPVMPRYGMGAPGRRGPDVTEDYGGRSGRGSSGSAAPTRESATPRGGLGGGRLAPTRTTGTGGGIGAGEGNYRLSKDAPPRPRKQSKRRAGKR